MPKLLPIVMRIAEIKGMDLTPGQGTKMARRFEKHRAELEKNPTNTRPRITTEQQALKYCLDYWDEVGELAISNVQQEIHQAAAARRLAT